MKRVLIILCLLVVCAGCVTRTPAGNQTAFLPSEVFPTADGSTPINQIQGITHRSSMEGETIAKVSGVVTALMAEDFTCKTRFRMRTNALLKPFT